MSTELTYFNIQCDVFKKLKITYINHLKTFINESNCKGLVYLLNKIYVPTELLSYNYLKNASSDILAECFDSMQQLDVLVEETLNLLGLVIDNNSAEISFKDIECISRKVNCIFSDENYIMYTLLNLLKSNSSYSVNNLLCNYRNTRYYFDKIMCDALYYADKDFIYRLIKMFKNKNYNYKFEPTTRFSHKDILKWLITNVKKGEKGEEIGWTSGPDSGTWPSKDLQDYIHTLLIVETLTHLNFNC